MTTNVSFTSFFIDKLTFHSVENFPFNIIFYIYQCPIEEHLSILFSKSMMLLFGVKCKNRNKKSNFLQNDNKCPKEEIKCQFENHNVTFAALSDLYLAGRSAKVALWIVNV